MKKGLFIVLEGPDGSGKSTVAAKIKTSLEDQGFLVCHTREPGGIDIAEQIRKVILDPKNTAMDEKTEALLYAASRRQHLIEKVVPAIDRGEIVLCERFVDSSLAYQGYARGIGIDEILNINMFAIDNHFPDLTIYLDTAADVGLKRIENRGFKDRLDQESLAFHIRVTEGYRIINKRFSDRIQTVDANRSIDEVVDACMHLISGKINA
ncbi:MAG: dTMP kinase [Erysipelotrichaceae bacterium]|nr:dTMP kinase [Erysipelotrichaceae bacterium]